MTVETFEQAFGLMLVKAVKQRGKQPGASNNRVELIRGGEGRRERGRKERKNETGTDSIFLPNLIILDS